MIPIRTKIQILKKIIPGLRKRLERCDICPRKCGINRIDGDRGLCRTSRSFKIASYNLHFGEEPCISGSSGSGAIFFSNCSLGCIFCQNYPISHLGNGVETTVEDLAEIMLNLQERGAHNINFVTPTHLVPQICEALLSAFKRGLKIPVVYNSSGYDSCEIIKLLEGVVDIYMPDAKYVSEDLSLEYSNAPDYHKINIAALREMYEQAGDIEVDSGGSAVKGLLIRHLVLPGCAEDSKQVLRAIAGKISPKVYMSIMSQYHPAHLSVNEKIIGRRLTVAEYRTVLSEADRLGICRGFRQEL